jgi:mycofactocin system FadH/OYE family oxidoreductase 2
VRQRYPHLFQPLQIRNVRLRNRITSSAHGTSLSVGGLPSESFTAYHQARARGGIGLIVIEGIRIHPTTMSHALAIAGWRPEIVEPLARVADVVHAEGAAIFAQILHQGRQVGSSYSQTRLLAPSPLPCPLYREIPSEMTHADIREIVSAFAGAAARVKAAGFDGVEIHGAHGYLIQEFLSPFSNERRDEYGGSLENRLRFPLEVLDAVRETVGDDFVVGLRVSVDEFTPGGLTVEDMKTVARHFVDTGKVDYLSLSQSNYNGASYSTMIPDMQFSRAAYVDLQAAVKAAVPELPTISVGRIIAPEEAERIIAAGQADLVAMTRAQIADPELANKARTGRADEIRTCISCNQGCAGMVHTGNPIRCVVNPAAGRELELSGVPPRAETARRVVVVGAGPAGLEAARVAASRGHEVTLLERGPVTGGQIRTAGLAEQRSEIVQLVDELEREVVRLGVHVRCRTEATADVVLAGRPEAVVLATGAVPAAGPLLDVADALQEPDAVGGRVLIADEDRHFKAAAAAEFFAGRGHEVVIAAAAPDVGIDIPGVSLVALKVRLGELGVRIFPSCKVTRVEGSTVTLTNLTTGNEERLTGIDSVIHAGAYRAKNELAAALAGRVPVLAVGDCLAPRRVLEAMREGHDAGLAVESVCG